MRVIKSRFFIYLKIYFILIILSTFIFRRRRIFFELLSLLLSKFLFIFLIFSFFFSFSFLFDLSAALSFFKLKSMSLISFRSLFDVKKNKELANNVFNNNITIDVLNENDARDALNNDNENEKLIRLIILKFQIIIYEIESL